MAKAPEKPTNKKPAAGRKTRAKTANSTSRAKSVAKPPAKATAKPRAKPAAKPKSPAQKKSAARKLATKKPVATKRPPTKKTAANAYQPWLNNYPEGIDWNAPLDLTPVHDRVLKACDASPNANALDFMGAKTTFGELGQNIRAFAAALQSEYGVKKGSRVALMLPNTPFYPVAYYAVLLCGGTVVNCNPLYTISELSHIVGNAGADILVTLDLQSIFDKAETLQKQGHVKEVIVWHFADALPLTKKILFSLFKRKDVADWKNGPAATACTPAKALLASTAKFTPVTITPDQDVAVQQYTGGTTGVPKGAMLSHANIAANVMQIDLWGVDLFRDPSKVMAVIPFFHIFGMTVCMNVPLTFGIEVVMMPKFDLKQFLSTASRTGANVLPAVPTLTNAIARGTETTSDLIKSLEVIISGGAALPNEVRTAFAKVSNALLAEGYGLTETSPVACCAPLRAPSKNMSIGQPLPGTDVRFSDLEDPTKILAPGERGEVQIKGPQVMLGYYQNPEATETAINDGWFRTGDVGYIDEDGFIFLVDRIKDMIICSGFNVYPRNIEEALYEHPAVDECNVIGVSDDYRGEAPVAFVKLNAGQKVTEEELNTFLAKTISKIELPREIIFKDELPKTLVGKLSKKELREEYAAMKGRTGD